MRLLPRVSPRVEDLVRDDVHAAAVRHLREHEGPVAPELSRRARGVEVWAALRALGRTGLADRVERCCRHARRFAEGLAAAGHRVLNDVSLNQVLVSFGEPERTRAGIAAVQAEGTCWCGVPLGEDLLQTAALRPGERVLDVACGTGVVTRGGRRTRRRRRIGRRRGREPGRAARGACHVRRLLKEVAPHVQFLFMLAGYVLGALAASGESLDVHDAAAAAALKGSYFEPAWTSAAAYLDEMHRTHGRSGIEVYAPLEEVVRSVYQRLGLVLTYRNGPLAAHTVAAWGPPARRDVEPAQQTRQRVVGSRERAKGKLASAARARADVVPAENHIRTKSVEPQRLAWVASEGCGA